MRTDQPRFRLVTDAASEPLTLADAKAFCQVDTSDDDALITSLIVAARRHIEKETGLALITQTWVAVFDAWPGAPKGSGLQSEWWDGVRQGPISSVVPNGVFEISKRPFQSVSAIRTRDAYGALSTVTATLYHTEVSDMRGRVMLKLGSVWPNVTLAPRGGIEVEFLAGFNGAPYVGVPDDLLTALKMLVKYWYDMRDPVSCETAGSKPLPFHFQAMLSNWQAKRLV